MRPNKIGGSGQSVGHAAEDSRAARLLCCVSVCVAKNAATMARAECCNRLWSVPSSRKRSPRHYV